MNKQEIIEKLKELLEKNALEVQKEVKLLEKEYKKIWTEEFEKAKQEFIDNGGKAKDFTYSKSAEDNLVLELLTKYEKKKEQEEEKLKQDWENNQKRKEELLEELEVLSDVDIKDITAIVKKLRQIQNEWNEIKEIKKSVYIELQRKYNLLLDKINQNIKAFYTLQEYDLQKNTEQKEALLNKFRELLSYEDMKRVDELYKSYLKEWREIGNVVTEKFAEIKDEFHAVTRSIKEKLDAYYGNLEEEKKKNLELKNHLLKQLKEIIEHLKSGENILWKDINEKVQKIKSEWEKIGYVPIDMAEKISTEYKRLLDIYYEDKREHQALIQKKQEEIRAIKEKLLKDAEQLLADGFEKNESKLKQIQQEWKRFYLRNKEENDALNMRFKEVFNAYYQKKKEIEKIKIQEEKDNLVKKLELIHRLKEFSFDKNKPEECIAKIQEFIKEWNAIGFVPIEEKDKVYDEFYGKINQLYKDLDLTEDKKQALQFKSKLQQLLQSSSNPIDTLNKEEKFIKKKISELESELAQIENSIAFFKYNKNNDHPLLKEMNDKKEKINGFIKEWKSKLNILKGVLSDYKNSTAKHAE